MATTILKSIVILTLIFTDAPLNLFEVDSTSNLTVTIDQIKEIKGPMVFVLFNNEDGFPNKEEKAYKLKRVKEYDKSASYTFKNIPFGDYAIMVYQDQDNDG